MRHKPWSKIYKRYVALRDPDIIVPPRGRRGPTYPRYVSWAYAVVSDDEKPDPPEGGRGITIPRAQTELDKLIAANLGLVYRVVNKHAGKTPGRERDELEQLGMIGLWNATKTYDPARGVAFSTWATHKIESEILTKSVRPEQRGQASKNPARHLPLSLEDPEQRAYGANAASFDDNAGDTTAELGSGFVSKHRSSRGSVSTFAEADDSDIDDSEDFEMDTMVRVRTGVSVRDRRTQRKAGARRRIVSGVLTERQREVMLALLDGKLQRELGPQSTIATAKDAALKKLRSVDFSDRAPDVRPTCGDNVIEGVRLAAARRQAGILRGRFGLAAVAVA